MVSRGSKEGKRAAKGLAVQGHSLELEVSQNVGESPYVMAHLLMRSRHTHTHTHTHAPPSADP